MVNSTSYCEDCDVVIPISDQGHETHTTHKKYAQFVGYQEDPDPMSHALPMYNVYGCGEKHGSTVTANTVIYLGINIPPTPSYEDWKAQK